MGGLGTVRCLSASLKFPFAQYRLELPEDFALNLAQEAASGSGASLGFAWLRFTRHIATHDMGEADGNAQKRAGLG